MKNELLTIGLSTRAAHFLFKNEIYTIVEYLNCPLDWTSLNVRNIGPKTRTELIEKQKELRMNGTLLNLTDGTTQSQEDINIDDVNNFVFCSADTGHFERSIDLDYIKMNRQTRDKLKIRGISDTQAFFCCMKTKLFLILTPQTVQYIVRNIMESALKLDDDELKGVDVANDLIDLLVQDFSSEHFGDSKSTITSMIFDMGSVFVGKCAEYDSAHDAIQDAATMEWLYNTSALKSYIRTSITLMLYEKASTTYDALWGIMPKTMPQRIFDDVLETLCEKGILSRDENGLRCVYISILEFADSLPDKREGDILIQRLNGLTLEEIAHVYGLTRERVRQIIRETLRKRPIVIEDKYADVFEKYNFSATSFCDIFEVGEFVFNYLKLTHKSGKANIDRLTEEEVDKKSYKIAQRVIEQKKQQDHVVVLDGEEIRGGRQAAVKYIIEKYFSRESVKYDEIVQVVNQTFVRNGYDSYTAKSISLFDMRFMLYSGSNYYRFWRFHKQDREFIREIRFEKFMGMAVSSQYVFDSCAQVMKKYDIRNRYELHHFLAQRKKLLPAYVSVGRKDVITIGETNIEQQVVQLIDENPSLSKGKIAILYSQKYGGNAQSIAATEIFRKTIANYDSAHPEHRYF